MRILKIEQTRDSVEFDLFEDEDLIASGYAESYTDCTGTTFEDGSHAVWLLSHRGKTTVYVHEVMEVGQ